MSHLLSKKGNKYNVWTTISDGWLSEKWLTETELKSWMAKQAEQKYKKDLIRDLWLFPYGWTMKNREVLRIDEETRNAHFEWEMQLLDCETKEEYDKMLDKKLKKLTKGLPDFYSI